MFLKNTIAAWLFLFPILMEAACDQNSPAPEGGDQGSITENTKIVSDTLLIKIGDKTFGAILIDNPTATAFKGLLPLNINMTELNGNEKYFRLSKNLPPDDKCTLYQIRRKEL